MGSDELKRILQQALGIKMKNFRVTLEVTEISFTVDGKRHVIHTGQPYVNDLLTGATTFLQGKEGSNTEALGIKLIKDSVRLLDQPWEKDDE